MIGRAMETWPSDALRRVVDAPVERWQTGHYGNSDGPRCLVGHAIGVNMGDEGFGERHSELCPAPFNSPVWQRFDDVCERFGVSRVVRLVKQRALRILEQRDATLGEPVRARVSA